MKLLLAVLVLLSASCVERPEKQWQVVCFAGSQQVINDVVTELRWSDGTMRWTGSQGRRMIASSGLCMVREHR